MTIREIKIEDVPEIAALHQSAFDKQHFSSIFSREDLIKYLTQLLNHNNFCYLALDENEICGYLFCGDKTQAAIDQFTSENKIKVIFYLFSHPKFLFEKISLKLKKLRSSKVKTRLYLIAISPRKQGKGIGKMLLQKLEESLISSSIKSYGLSVRKDNLQAFQFYKKLGFTVEHKTDVSYSLVKNL